MVTLLTACSSGINSTTSIQQEETNKKISPLYDTSGIIEKAKEITLKEAYHNGLGIAQKEDSTAELLFMNSVDDKKPSGLNGKRSDWNLMFVLPKKQSRLIVEIRKGIINKTQNLNDVTSEEIVYSNDLKLDSSSVTKKVISDNNMKLGEGPLFYGIHFNLVKYQGKTILSVTGSNDLKQHIDIHLDATNGKVLGNKIH